MTMTMTKPNKINSTTMKRSIQPPAYTMGFVLMVVRMIVVIATLQTFIGGVVSFPTTTTTLQQTGSISSNHQYHHNIRPTITSSSSVDDRQGDTTLTMSSLKTSTKPFRNNNMNNRRKKRKLCQCPTDDDDTILLAEHDDDDDHDMMMKSSPSSSSMEDRREAIFAMMGTMWAASSSASSSTIVGAILGFPNPAYGVAGVDANMAFPDIFQGLNDRNTKQCLVESLGNRECLVYREDEEKLLYKGANTQSLVERIMVAYSALQLIPPLVEKQQWTKITGVLTGPMGQLSATLSLLVNMADNPAVAKAQAQKVKNDLFSMGTATTQRQGSDVLKYYQLATEDLATFLKAL